MLSNAVRRDDRGIAASLVNTVIDYSIALSLGFAGTVEQQIIKDDGLGPETSLKGFRAAWYFAIGLCVLGLGNSLAFRIRAVCVDGRLPSTGLSV